MKRIPCARLAIAAAVTVTVLDPPRATGEASTVPAAPTMFGGQLVRGTTLDGAMAMEVGGGGALYVRDTALYWGGGGGHVFQVGDTEGQQTVHLFHGELMLGLDLLRARHAIVSAMGMAGVGMTRDESGLFGVAEARLALRRPLTRWFMLGGHLAYRRAFRSGLEHATDAGLSGPILGLELYFTH